MAWLVLWVISTLVCHHSKYKKYDIWYEKVYKLGEINNQEKTREFLSDLPLLTTDELTDYHDVLVAYSLTI